MNSQAKTIKSSYEIEAKVIVVDYGLTCHADQGKELFERLSEQLSGLEVCIFINNQTCSVPIEFASMDLLDTSIKSCMAQIGKHVKCQMLSHLVVVPKMLERHEQDPIKRSAILTLKARSQFGHDTQFMKNTLQYPILRSAMGFSASMNEALARECDNMGIDFMQAQAPFLAFESVFTQGLLLQVLWNEKLIKQHVKTVLQ